MGQKGSISRGNKNFKVALWISMIQTHLHYNCVIIQTSCREKYNKENLVEFPVHVVCKVDQENEPLFARCYLADIIKNLIKGFGGLHS